MASDVDRRLCGALRDHPLHYSSRFTDSAHQHLIQFLFQALSNYDANYLDLLFARNVPRGDLIWKLRDAQGAVEGSEYTETARGKRCGHIFKSGEATYRCKTCTADDTCVLCARCFDASDHTGHSYFINVSPGNSGCCDCGDPEAWKVPVKCAIHTATASTAKVAENTWLPDDLRESIQTTIGRAFDYICDVISCSPEQLRLQKTEENIRADEEMSRLKSEWYGEGDQKTAEPEFALVLWNDEKHTVMEVRDQVARACKQTKLFGMNRANEANDIGRSVVKHSKNLKELLHISRIIEQIKVTVTIRSSRDTFREQMCGAIIEWLVDIAGCSVGDDNDTLRRTICTEMLSRWRTGSEATNAEVGRSGIDDHEIDESKQLRQFAAAQRARNIIMVAAQARAEEEEDDDDDDDDDDDELEERIEAMENDDDEDDETFRTTAATDGDEMDLDQTMTMMTDSVDPSDADGDVEMQTPTEQSDDLEVAEATLAGYPPPPPPPPRLRPLPTQRNRLGTAPIGFPVETPPGISGSSSSEKANIDIPKTPFGRSKVFPRNPASHWEYKPSRYFMRRDVPPWEDLWNRLRLDWMILYDLRLWKKARIDLRDLYISTIVTIPEFKRVLGLRFAGLYTPLAQLYLIADREPDHSIINLSLQMLTTPSITEEVVERGNFLTNLMAILYTFLTTRQVGHPHDVSSKATLAFDSGSVTNRRLYHFFVDLKYLLQSPYVQEKVRTEEPYVLQFLDLVKLPQGICPNVRAVGDHVEYETDAWIGASLLTREINRLCRQFSEAFMQQPGQEMTAILAAIRLAAKATIYNSMGAERKRFDQAEIKHATAFKRIGAFEFEGAGFTPENPWDTSTSSHLIVDFTVDKGAISFHHALHYTFSWLVECGKSMPVGDLRSLLLQSVEDVKKVVPRNEKYELDPEAYLMAAFDFPLRVCAWLAQMKAGMWVRNGLSLRHQMSQYRGVSSRDVAHHRDIFLLQTALVVCDPTRVLVSMIDRFGMGDWMTGNYRVRSGFEDAQLVDVAEDFIYLMIVLLSDRSCLITVQDEPDPLSVSIRRDLAHILCFKPLSFSDIQNRLNEKLHEADEFQEILEEMTNFRSPEGLNDTGTFELKPQYIELIDPYGAHYSKNQRDEAENIYKNWMAKRTKTAASDLVYEPKLQRIKTGTFTELAAFTRTPLFAQIIYFALGYALQAKTRTPSIAPTRVEAFLQVVLHLALIATLEDDTDENGMTADDSKSFIRHALTTQAGEGIPNCPTIITILQRIANMEEFSSCSSKIHLILKKFLQKCPSTYFSAVRGLNFPFGVTETNSPASNADSDAEVKKKMALERQAKVMAQFQQQQQKFLDTQGGSFDWGEEDLSDLESEVQTAGEAHKKKWKYPTGTCMYCKEDTNDSKLYGTFALITDSNILRQSDLSDPDFAKEVVLTPSSLDRSADAIRPFGVSGDNHQVVKRLTSAGEEIISERSILGKGFPASSTRRGPVTTGCGHMMHYSCFLEYTAASQRRHNHQIARNHPERLTRKEFVCSLCKALGNTFLPIIWRGKEEVYPGALAPEISFNEWLGGHLGKSIILLQKPADQDDQRDMATRCRDQFVSYISKNMIPPLASKLDFLFQPRTSTSPSSFPRIPSLMALNPFRPQPAEPIGPSSPTYAIENTEASLILELVSVYKRLCETMRANVESHALKHLPPGSAHHADFAHADSLARSIGFSIAAVEIAQRGIESQPGCTLLDKIPQQQLTHLRILSETAFAYTAIGGISQAGPFRTSPEFVAMVNRQIYQLFIVQPPNPREPDLNEFARNTEPLLAQDMFVFLAQCSVAVVPALNADVHHFIRLCYVAEIIKAVMVISENFGGVGETGTDLRNEEVAAPDSTLRQLRALAYWIGHELDQPIKAFSQRSPFTDASDWKVFTKMVASYALAFLRKVTVLLHVRYGVEFPNTGYADLEDSELDRLTRMLRLPTLVEVFSYFNPPDDLNDLQRTARGWLLHWKFVGESSPDIKAPLTLSHPAIFELVGLPKHFDVLTEETMRRKCPTTGKELTDPSICLFCGDIFCSQAVCCMGSGKLGGCNQHIEKCGKDVGLFINIRKCMIFYLHNQHGSWQNAPYLDKHGEVDPGLRRNRQLILNQKRYDALLRNVWLQHGVPATISRKLEADINNGGWETI